MYHLIRQVVEFLRRIFGPLSQDDFDAQFYYANYKDLSHINSSRRLRRHYLRYGRSEGRYKNRNEARAALASRFTKLPKTFDPAIYKLLNPSLAHKFVDDFQYERHFLEHGLKDGLPYRIQSSGTLPFLPWHALFKTGDFLADADWLVHTPQTREQALIAFSGGGIEHLTTIHKEYFFDPAFYRNQYATSSSLGDADLYRSWLTDGLLKGYAPNEGIAIASYIPVRCYPACFDWPRYIRLVAKRGRHLNWNRIDALTDLFTSDPTESSKRCIEGPGSADLFGAIGDFHLSTGDPSRAIRAYNAALEICSSAKVLHRRGEAHRSLGNEDDALRDFSTAADMPKASIWSHLNAAELEAKRGLYHKALSRLLLSQSRWPDNIDLSSAGDQIIDSCFSHLISAVAFDLTSTSNTTALGIIENVLTRILQTQRQLGPKPAPLKTRHCKMFLLLACLDLPQCTHYRVEQKQRQFAHLGLELQVFDLHNVDSFISALPSAEAALFYRVPAFPKVIHAITIAQSLGIGTFYDIDDPVFDYDYPDTLDSYQEQITAETYRGLQIGVPLYRFAMSLCDYGIASTQVLANRMQAIVRRHICFVVPNGLDGRNAMALQLGEFPPASRNRVTIFYGSGTKAHNSDFNEILGPALLGILTRYQNVDLVVAGYLKLRPEFDKFGVRIRTFGWISDLNTYWSLLATSDINIAVLARNSLNDAKSEIKWLEAAVLSIPSIVTPTATYKAVTNNWIDAVWAADRDEWITTLDRLITQPSLRANIGAAARRKAVERYGIETTATSLKYALEFVKHGKKADVQPRNIVFPRAGDKIKVLICNVFFRPQSRGGATRVVEGNVDYILDHCPDIAVSVLTTDAGRGPPGLLISDSYRGVAVYRITTPQEPNMEWRFVKEDNASLMNRVLDVVQPQLVHFHSIQRLTSSVVRETARQGIPYFVTPHDGWWICDYQFFMDDDDRLVLPEMDLPTTPLPAEVTLLQSIERKRRLCAVLNHAKQVVCVSDSLAMMYRAAGIRNVSTVANGINKMPPKVVRARSHGRLVLGHIGGRSAHKGAFLVEAILRRNAFKNLLLRIVDPMIEYPEEREERWGETPIVLLGQCPQDMIGELYGSFDVLIAPSVWPESYGLVTREALSYGLWVIASDRGAVGSEIMQGVNGFVVDVSTPTALTEVLSRLDAEPERYKVSPSTPIQMRTSDEQGRELAEIYRACAKERFRETMDLAVRNVTVEASPPRYPVPPSRSNS
jgi:glycosyltransferase involved in cell wall biosynthesis/tetratricopeptide (TPR) repeat protein